MITKYLFGTLDGGQEVYNYTLKNANGMSVTITEYGGAVVSLYVPDKDGRFTDVVSGFDNLRDYVLYDGYIGALIGRVGNRIGKGQLTVNGKDYQLYCNDGENTLHGGKFGYNARIWTSEPEDGDAPKLRLSLLSPDGEENYPGNLNISVVYTLTEDNALSIEYTAVTDQTTPVNLTNHTYFNLGGFASGTILNHILQMDADTYIPTDAHLIPTGEIRSVEGTPFDFRTAKTIGQDFDTVNNEDMRLAGGYDHCFNFVGGATDEPKLRIAVYEPESHRLMNVYTDQPSVQLYTGNFYCEPEQPVKGGCKRQKQHMFCLETQKMPDAVHHTNFTNVMLQPGEVYHHHTVYQFTVK